MRIECPDCGARYEVPETRLAPGRAARCVRCGREWFPLVAEPPPLLTEPDPAPAPPTFEEPQAAPLRPATPFVPAPLPMANGPTRRSKALLAAWAISIAAVAAFLVLAVLLRDPIARAWPPSLRAYNALNLPVAEGR